MFRKLFPFQIVNHGFCPPPLPNKNQIICTTLFYPNTDKLSI